jgi:hypothetical protein
MIDLSLEVVAKLTYRTNNDFPRFSDGDVFIDLGLLSPLRYQIHSAVLSRASSWFDETLACPIKEFDDTLAAKTTSQTGIRARYELVFNSDLHMFVLERAVSIVFISCFGYFSCREIFLGKVLISFADLDGSQKAHTDTVNATWCPNQYRKLQSKQRRGEKTSQRGTIKLKH